MTTTSEVTFELVDMEGGKVPVRTELSYEPNDPYAVRMIFSTGSRSSVEWVFSRELLDSGLTAEAGKGDVVICPLRHRPGYVQVALEAPSGMAYFEVNAAELRSFLDRTYVDVPRGTEAEHYDLDAELAALLGADASREN